MAGIKDADHIKELRERLYARNAEAVRVGRHELSPNQTPEVPRVWRDAESKTSATATPKQSQPRVDARVDIKRQSDARAAATPPAKPDAAQAEPRPAPAVAQEREAAVAAGAAPSGRSRSYRWYIVIFSLFILVAGVGFSTFYLLLGLNEISGRNIDVSITAPSSIGAGETIPIDLTVHNQNPVSVVSATLVIDYPTGTQSAEEEGRVLHTERIALDTINAGEVLEVPVRAVVFGEVDEEKTIQMRLEYRVEGTNSTLERQIDPIEFRITSSPIVVRVDAVEQVSAGQDIDITLTVDSNAPNALQNVLVTAEFPQGFDFTEADPQPVFGNNTWRFNEIASGGSETISITGAFVGGQNDEFTMDFTAGVPRADNQYILGSTFSRTQRNFTIEAPFIRTELTANSTGGRTVTLDSGRTSDMNLSLTNTLNESVYDMFVTVNLSGNALDPASVDVTGGFYDSSTDTVRFDVTTNSNLEEVPAGAQRRFGFSMRPAPIGTAQLEAEVNVFARRVSDSQAEERLIGSERMTVQYSSVIDTVARLSYDTGPFTNTGPIPPVAEEETTYTLTLVAEAGRNDVTDAQVTTSLPTYISWLDTYEGPGSVSYNSVNKELTWDIGSIAAEERAELALQVAFRPSISQVGNTPAILHRQHIRATDRFTGSVIRGEGDPVNAELPRSAGFERGNGEVRRTVANPDDD